MARIIFRFNSNVKLNWFRSIRWSNPIEDFGILGNGLVFDSTAGRVCLGGRLVRVEKRFSSGTMNRLVRYGLYGYTMCMGDIVGFARMVIGSNVPSLRERLRFRTRIYFGSWIRWLRVRLDGKSGDLCGISTQW